MIQRVGNVLEVMGAEAHLDLENYLSSSFYTRESEKFPLHQKVFCNIRA